MITSLRVLLFSYLVNTFFSRGFADKTAKLTSSFSQNLWYTVIKTKENALIPALFSPIILKKVW